MTDLTGRTVVALHAHPDDESLITGGTLAGLAAMGARVVLVTCTAGGSGLADERFGSDDALAQVRRGELQAAADALGVARLECLGYVDSGSDKANLRPDGFCFSDVDEVAARVAAIVVDEAAELLIGYDEAGGYGHPDHVQVHRVGARAAELSGVSGYLEATVERRSLVRAARVLSFVPVARRLVPADRFASSWSDAGRMTATVDVRPWVDAKRAGLKAHASQASGGGIRTVALLSRLPGALGRRVLGTEWFTGPGPVVASGGGPEVLFPPRRSLDKPGDPSTGSGFKGAGVR